MLRKNLEVIVLDLKKSTNGRKQIVKFITVKISFFLRQCRPPKDQVVSTAGMSAHLMTPFPNHNYC